MASNAKDLLLKTISKMKNWTVEELKANIEDNRVSIFRYKTTIIIQFFLLITNTEHPK